MPNIFSRLLELLPASSRKRRQFTLQGRTALPGLKYSWKMLLSGNTRLWRQVLTSRRVLQGQDRLDMLFVRSQSTTMCVTVFSMIRLLREMTERKLNILDKPFDNLRQRITSEISPPAPSADLELTVPLSRLDASMSLFVGAKMAMLGEIRRNTTQFHVPEGFVITAAAYRLFMEHQGLRDEINRRLQSLEMHNPVDLFRISSELQLMIINAPLPQILEEAIHTAYRELESVAGHRGIRVALRASVAGEDAPGISFAGQYRTELNVSEDLLFMAYKEIIASKYSLTAMNYRLARGLREDDLPVCVGCMIMMDTAVSGMIITRPPIATPSSNVFVNAVHGLVKAISDGYVDPDVWEVQREPEPRIWSEIIREKPERFVSFLSEEGVTLLPNQASQRGRPALAGEQVLLLSRIGMDLEKLLARPLDIEWSISRDGKLSILQTRPLLQADDSHHHKIEAPKPVASLIQDGQTASQGLACGPVFLVRNNNDLLHFPDGAILVTARPHPRWSALLPRAAAIVTEKGGVFSQLANIAREFKIPALFSVPEATAILQTGQWITVDATEQRITSASPESVTLCPKKEGSALLDTPVHKTLATVMTSVEALSLVNPLDPRIGPENIQTLRDVAQICLLHGCRQMLELTHISNILHPLAVAHPTNWWVLDLDDPRLDHPDLSGQASTPMLPEMHIVLAAIWDGIACGNWTHYANSPHQFPLLRHIRRLRAAVRAISTPRPRIFLISENSTHLYLALERALFSIQIQTGSVSGDNSICFLWQWFSPNIPAQSWLETIFELLHDRGFAVDLKADGLFAWSVGEEQAQVLDQARFLGYLISHVQETDHGKPLPPEIDLPIRGFSEGIGESRKKPPGRAAT